jgi:hypothetical protein
MKKWTLVSAAKHWWRLWSVRFDAIMYAVLGYFIAYPAELDKLVEMLPDGLQKPVAFAIPIVLFAAKTGSRVVKQEKVAARVNPPEQ